jgi:hypothetical protein
MLMPNLIFYCGLNAKEIEMVFLAVFFLERIDLLLRSKKYNFFTILPPFLAAGALFFFRTALGAVVLLALITAVLFSSKKVVNWRQRIIVGIWAIAVVGFFLGGRISTELEETWNSRGEAQEQSMQWRTNRKGGNQYAKYMSGTVFAPVIFVIPITTIVETNQYNLQLIHGGNYVKNIMAFFTIFALFMAFKRKEWRKYILTGSYMVGYLIVIAFSPFAQSERFHQPALPFILLFAAYGISLCTNKTKKYFNYYSIFIFGVIMVWNFFKLSGRGLI